MSVQSPDFEPVQKLAAVGVPVMPASSVFAEQWPQSLRSGLLHIAQYVPVLDFLGLERDERVMQFHQYARQRGYIWTPSYVA